MKRPPPYVVRRFVLAPAVVLVAVAAVGWLPLWAVIAAFASRFVPGRWRPLRIAWFLFVYLVLEAVALVALFSVWVAAGFGRRLDTPGFRALHYRLAGWWLGLLMASARRTFRLQIEAGHPIEQELRRPIIVLCRHAGPGDSILLVEALLNRRHRRPRIVLKDLLQLDPCIDVVLNRLPNRFVPSTGRAGQEVVDGIVELAAGMGPDGALVIFPEGGNFTPGRHARAIEKLDEIGRPDLADRARALHHVLPPKPVGALAAIESAPDADVVFVGHAGLEHLSSVTDVWRGIPMDSRVVARTWHVPASEIPSAADRERWLYERWADLDAWIDDVVASRSRSQS